MWAVALGLVIQGYGQMQANQAQADAEAKNAGFYREQADFAREAGERQIGIFNRESDMLYGEQQSAFAKAGVDTQSSSLFMAKQMLHRQDESYAIKAESDMNVRLAMLRASQADSTAASLRDPQNTILPILGSALGAYGSSGASSGSSGRGGSTFNKPNQGYRKDSNL
jgi:hypothetical protein